MDRRRELLSVREKKINTFTVIHTHGGTEEYQFEEGMIWEDWINSDYNEGSFIVHSSLVFNINGFYLRLNNKDVLSTDIIFNTTYGVRMPTGGSD